jgi:hypothetical protein
MRRPHLGHFCSGSIGRVFFSIFDVKASAAVQEVSRGQAGLQAEAGPSALSPEMRSWPRDDRLKTGVEWQREKRGCLREVSRGQAGLQAEAGPSAPSPEMRSWPRDDKLKTGANGNGRRLLLSRLIKFKLAHHPETRMLARSARRVIVCGALRSGARDRASEPIASRSPESLNRSA